MKIVSKILLILIICSLSQTYCYAQKERTYKVKNIRGEYELYNNTNISIAQAHEEALKNAKKQAIAEVCGEQITAWDRMASTSVGESFNSLAINQVNGEIVSYEIVEESISAITGNSALLCYCIINAEVKKGMAPDLNFKASIGGIDHLYVPGDVLSFSVMPFENGYLNIFLMENEKVGYKLYPNDYDRSKLLERNNKYTFPENSDLTIGKSTDNPIETNYLVFVFTKQEYKFYETTSNWADIESWIAKIPNNEKYIEYIPIEIREKRPNSVMTR